MNYPRTVLEVIDPKIKFRPATIKSVRWFRKMRPWHGSPEKRQQKFAWLNQALARTYGIRTPDLRFGLFDGSHSGGSHYIPIELLFSVL